MESKICAACKKEFTRKGKDIKFCSFICYASSRRKLEIINCATCSKQFKQREKNSKYCSLKCRDKNKSEIRKCLVCKCSFKVTIGIINRGRNAGKFCSQKCYTIFSKGKNNPNWRGGDTFNKCKKHWQMIKLKASVRERDNYTCQKCGANGENVVLDTHHIIPYRITKDNSLTNLVTLCHRCHMKEAKNELKYYK